MLIDRAEIPDLWVLGFNNLKHYCLKLRRSRNHSLPSYIFPEFFVASHFGLLLLSLKVLIYVYFL